MAGSFYRCLLGLVAFGLTACGDGRPSGDALIAVATNFRDAATILEDEFEDQTGFEISLAAGATGQLYAQIVNGAPYDVLLSADQERPAMLVDEGIAVAGSRFTYATGKLVLWSPDPDALDDVNGPDVLEAGQFRALAIANPELAPYGRAAMEMLRALGLAEVLKAKLVRGQTVGQAFSMVASSNAEFGLIAKSQVSSQVNTIGGSSWEVPGELHTAIHQDAVLLERASKNRAAIAFMEFLKTEDARIVIDEFGYEPG